MRIIDRKFIKPNRFDDTIEKFTNKRNKLPNVKKKKIQREFGTKSTKTSANKNKIH